MANRKVARKVSRKIDNTATYMLASAFQGAALSDWDRSLDYPGSRTNFVRQTKDEINAQLDKAEDKRKRRAGRNMRKALHMNAGRMLSR